MLSYQELYEYLRKEKYGEQLQSLPKNFVTEFAEYARQQKARFAQENDMFSADLLKDKKQFENAFALFKELILRRKKKILNLVFVAAETGIMKRDFADMLTFEQELFDKLVKSMNESDKQMSEELNGKAPSFENSMIIILDDVEEFVDMSGNSVGPFQKGVMINIEKQVAEILVNSGKAARVDSA